MSLRYQFAVQADRLSRSCFTLETYSIRQTANRSLQLRVCSFALPRFQALARRSVQFSLLLLSQNIIQYKNTYKNCKVGRESRRNQKAYEAWVPQSQRNKQNIMKFAEWYVKNRNQTETDELSYEFNNKIEKKINSGLKQNTFLVWQKVVSTAERNIKSIWTTRSLFRAAILFSSSRSASL